MAKWLADEEKCWQSYMIEGKRPPDFMTYTILLGGLDPETRLDECVESLLRDDPVPMETVDYMWRGIWNDIPQQERFNLCWSGVKMHRLQSDGQRKKRKMR